MRVRTILFVSHLCLIKCTIYSKFRARYVIPLAVGSTFTTVGFAFKIWSSYHTDILGAWITAVILLCMWLFYILVHTRN